MNNAALQVLLDHLEAAAPGSASLSIARLEHSDDPVLVLVAALLGTSPSGPLARAAHLARSTRDRQLVAISTAHLAGDHDRARELVREHLVDYPNHPIVDRIIANDGDGASDVPDGSGINGWLRWRE